ncbi:MAG: hypothetical protein SPJ07_06010 [Bacilli bacterium]|nr:hypothetical protein [Bacilli bacterium]
MENKKSYIWLVVLTIIGLLVFYGIKIYRSKKILVPTNKYINYTMNPKTYDVNEYNLVNINDRQLAAIYLNDYRNYLKNNIDQAYELLNEEYRSKKFNNIEEFKTYINTININNMSVEKYNISDDKKIIDVYISNNDRFIFKIKNILEYEVYLDDTTVEI